MSLNNGQRTTDDRRSLLCVPVCVRRVDELRAAVARAVRVADIIELRLDCLTDEAQLAAARTELERLFVERARPFILTFRATEQGGQRALDAETRVRFWQQYAHAWQRGTPRPDFVDIELDLLEAHRNEVWPAQQDKETRATIHIDPSSFPALICSQHDFDGVPADLAALYERMTRTPAQILKLALRAQDATDCLPLLQLLARARREGRDMIAIAMGAAGLLTRILAPARGAFLTYGALDQNHATAPGQTSAAELRDVYRVHTLDEWTEVFGLVGTPVMHSLSPYMHNAAFAARGLNAVYIPFETRDLSAFMRRMADPRTRELDWRLRGLSVTAPHKQTIMPHLDQIEPAVREIGAVNTVLIKDDALHGYNTDAPAALAPLANLLELHGARVALVGTGGAARALLWGLRRAAASTTVFVRNIERARTVAHEFGAACLALSNARFNDFDLVINATPLGTHGHAEDETPATVAQLRGARIAYDLIYNPTETRFMREARAAGCAHVIGGLSMLVAQAAAQFELWTGQSAPLEVMRDAAARQLFAKPV